MDALTPNHPEIVELLPDYAIGALDGEELERVSRHLEECASCRRELQQLLALVGVLADVAPPRGATRDRLLARARSQEPPGRTAPPPDAEPLPVRALPAERSPATGPEARRPTPWPRPALVGALAAAAVLLVAIGVWNLRPNNESSDRDAIAAIVAGATAHPLTDGQLSPPASGVLFTAADDDRAALVAEGLPPLPADQRYQIWLFADDGERTSGGLFAADPGGRAEVVIDPPQPLAAYAAVAVSAEPAAGSQAPTSPLALGGWLAD